MNAFLDFAEKQIVAPRKAQLRAAEKRAAVLAEKHAEQSTCLKEWHQWRRGQVAAALAGPQGPVIAELVARLNSAKHWDDVPLVSEFMQLDPDTLYLVRRLINERIAELRMAAGLAPFDDGLEGV
jgi:hypothetical protein